MKSAMDEVINIEWNKRQEGLPLKSPKEAIILASIVEKEGNSKEQFNQISSVLHNRLEKAWKYPALECDSTRDYVEKYIYNRVHNNSDRNKYFQN